jgi:hypothetical protein
MMLIFYGTHSLRMTRKKPACPARMSQLRMIHIPYSASPWSQKWLTSCVVLGHRREVATADHASTGIVRLRWIKE